MILFEYASAIGQDSHGFVTVDSSGKPVNPWDNDRLVLGGCVLLGEPALQANSDGDVILHALTNAISGISGVNVLGSKADQLCLEQGIKDSRAYLALAMETLVDWQICHVSFSVECKHPKLSPHIPFIRQNIADLLSISVEEIGLTATTGEGLSAFGRGEGISVFCCLSARRPQGNSL